MLRSYRRLTKMKMYVLLAAVGFILIHSCRDVTAKRNRHHKTAKYSGSGSLGSPTAAPDSTPLPEEVKSWLGRLGLEEFTDALEEEGCPIEDFIIFEYGVNKKYALEEGCSTEDVHLF